MNHLQVCINNSDFTFWINHFQNNKLAALHMDAVDQTQLTTEEYNTIYQSIQQFQIGESSEGKYLMKAANEYLKDKSYNGYAEALKLFIQEEQRHARYLAYFMKVEDIPVIKKHWIDQIFRKLRRLASLKQSITVLLAAEIIATVYYEALKNVTNSKLLIDICNRLLLDEAKHVEFQSITLNRIDKNKSPFKKQLQKSARFTFLMGTLFTVWFSHKKVLKNGGYPFSKYIKTAIKEFQRSETIIHHS